MTRFKAWSVALSILMLAAVAGFLSIDTTQASSPELEPYEGGSCYYNGVWYAEYTTTCVNGRYCRCVSGSWDDLGPCRD